MGEELLTKDSPEKSKITIADYIDQQFPYYIAMGMTAHDYWHGDPCMLRAYRKADIIKRDRMNHKAWLQGAYIYSALCAASPLFNSMSKQRKAFPYQEKPFSVPEKKKHISKKEQEKNDMFEMLKKFKAMSEEWNAQFEMKSKKNGGGGNG